MSSSGVLMIDEQLDFELDQLAGGTLSADREAAVRALLSTDAVAAEAFEGYQNLNRGLRALPPTPEINWSRLAAEISERIKDAAVIAPVHAIQPSAVDSYPMPWLRRAGAIAVAASVALVVGVGIRQMNRSAVQPIHSTPSGRIEVAGPAVDSPAGAVIQQITIGPSPSVASVGDAVRYGDSGVVSHPQRVVIASGVEAAQDTNQDSSTTPY